MEPWRSVVAVPSWIKKPAIRTHQTCNQKTLERKQTKANPAFIRDEFTICDNSCLWRLSRYLIFSIEFSTLKFYHMSEIHMLTVKANLFSLCKFWFAPVESCFLSDSNDQIKRRESSLPLSSSRRTISKFLSHQIVQLRCEISQFRNRISITKENSWCLSWFLALAAAVYLLELWVRGNFAKIYLNNKYMVQRLWRVKSCVTIDGRVLEALRESWKCKRWSFGFFLLKFWCWWRHILSSGQLNARYGPWPTFLCH